MVFLNSVPSWLAALLLLCLWSSTSGLRIAV
ncbi:hypothetical protein DNTS_003614 [Danionella cerebrum]|uniref:Uncharacterized protein n=1 Tax=Danionella cerebrum TaxID=2873325 RepID=A0A553NRH2_9TELE|nr:hypothetical protein DNTS_003614 [Danionella translucida]